MTDDVFEDLVNLYLDKEISPAQLRILKEELLRNSDRRSTFESYCRMHQATHFAALSAAPVIPRLHSNLEPGKGKPAFFALSRQVFAAATIIAVVGSFATIYFNGPFGKSRIVQVSQSNLQPIERFAQPAEPFITQPTLEFFRADNQSAAEEWAYLQELRHARATPEFQSSQEPALYTWVDGEIREKKKTVNPGPAFEFEYSNYEFRR
ncbi:hypothetical protein F7C95_09005 [Opitutia bacterium ISCC 51]|nr:hypothetical protein F7C95_09005 [Opitutae bacterium ISCC 51]QXD30068.1 hypothetical protein GA003_08950 [Opitutae bacterium ISCC 52]